MRRKLAILTLGAFMLYTGAYIFVYLWRAFRIDLPQEVQPVFVHHADPFTRAVLVAVLFLIGLVVLVYLALARHHRLRSGQVSVRQDLWQWLVEQAEETNEPPSRLAERALSSYRTRLEGSRQR